MITSKADFSSIPRRDLVTELICRRRRYRSMHVVHSRRQENRPSCLNKKELIMIGDLDQCNQSGMVTWYVDREKADHQSLNPFYRSMHVPHSVRQKNRPSCLNKKELLEEEEADNLCNQSGMVTWYVDREKADHQSLNPFYRSMHVAHSIRKKNRPSCLNKKELIMIGDLDQEEEEADNLCNQSRMVTGDVDRKKADHQSLNPFYLSSEFSFKEKDMCLTFAELLIKEEFMRPKRVCELMMDLAPYPSDFNKEYFVDKRSNESKPVTLPTYELGGHKKFLIEVNVEEYRRLMEHNRGRWRRRLI